MRNRIILAAAFEGVYRMYDVHPGAANLEAVSRFRRQGHLFGVVTHRDCFEALANMGEYEEEYDFIICSTGGCVVPRLPVGELFGAPTRIHTDTANRYFLGELYDLFMSVGVSRMTADIFGFMGGDNEGYRLEAMYDPSKGCGCWAHFWGGDGKYQSNRINRDAFDLTSSFSQVRGTFKNGITAQGLARECCRRFRGHLRAYAEGNDVIVVPTVANNADGIARYAKFAGVDEGDIWTFGKRPEDKGMLTRFNGIGYRGSESEAWASTGRSATKMDEVLQIIEELTGGEK